MFEKSENENRKWVNPGKLLGDGFAVLCSCREWTSWGNDKIIEGPDVFFEAVDFDILHECPNLRVWQQKKGLTRIFMKLQ